MMVADKRRFDFENGRSVQPNNPCMLCGRISDTGLYSFCYRRMLNLHAKTLTDLIKRTPEIRKHLARKRQFKKHLFQNESRGSKLHMYKIIISHFYKAVFINSLVFFSDRYRCLRPPFTAKLKILQILYSHCLLFALKILH